MKGLIFVEMLKMAENLLGETAVDEVLDSLPLESNGAYATVGSYPCSELLMLVDAFSARSGLSPADLQRKFGHYALASFKTQYPQFFVGHSDSFSLLDSIDGRVHGEVRKIYPEAELPSFQTCRPRDGEMVMTYFSTRPLISLCHGLIEACIDEFDETAEISVIDHSTAGSVKAEFIICKVVP